jgi:hypothetical protein
MDDNVLITAEARAYKDYIESKWGHLFHVELEKPLRDLFPKPEQKFLHSIWRLGAADIVVFKNSKPICVLEPGGRQHYDEVQAKRDARKQKLCSLNNVKCLHIMNGTMSRVSKRQWKKFIGSYLFGQ